MLFLPPNSVTIEIRRAPASIEFSTSSLMTEAGRSTTSPAAIWFANADGSRWIFCMRPPILHCSFCSADAPRLDDAIVVLFGRVGMEDRFDRLERKLDEKFAESER